MSISDVAGGLAGENLRINGAQQGEGTLDLNFGPFDRILQLLQRGELLATISQRPLQLGANGGIGFAVQPSFQIGHSGWHRFYIAPNNLVSAQLANTLYQILNGCCPSINLGGQFLQMTALTLLRGC